MRHLFCLLLLVASPNATAQHGWTRSTIDDPLHGVSFQRFALDGEYLTPPSVGSARTPSLVVNCFGGKRKDSYLDVGAVVRPSGTRSLSGVPQSYVEMRVDDRKPDVMYLGISADGTGLFFDTVQLIKFMTGRLLGHPTKPSDQVHRLIVGVGEALSNQVVIQFDMRVDHSEMIRACGIEWGKEKKALK